MLIKYFTVSMWELFAGVQLVYQKHGVSQML